MKKCKAYSFAIVDGNLGRLAGFIRTTQGQYAAVLCAPSYARASAIAKECGYHVSARFLREYGSVSGNQEHLAMAEKGEGLYISRNAMNYPWEYVRMPAVSEQGGNV